ncbi:hypothetical protein [Paenarthrobacter sp. NPDC089316]|uniref:hypothetical protein n=1 Tax=unclassified Paenarthrobacter TaxID=2634190 RepID=UPI003435DA6D
MPGIPAPPLRPSQDAVSLDLVFIAANADMEFTTRLPAARHHIQNLLAAFSLALCRQDAVRLADLIRGVRISNGSAPSTDPAQILGWFNANHHPAAQTIHNLSVQFTDGAVHYSGFYQDWNSGPHWNCTAIRSFSGRLKAGHQVWRWEEHSMHLLAPTAPPSDYGLEALQVRPAAEIKTTAPV